MPRGIPRGAGDGGWAEPGCFGPCWHARAQGRPCKSAWALPAPRQFLVSGRMRRVQLSQVLVSSRVLGFPPRSRVLCPILSPRVPTGPALLPACPEPHGAASVPCPVGPSGLGVEMPRGTRHGGVSPALLPVGSAGARPGWARRGAEEVWDLTGCSGSWCSHLRRPGYYFFPPFLTPHPVCWAGSPPGTASLVTLQFTSARLEFFFQNPQFPASGGHARFKHGVQARGSPSSILPCL